MHRSESEPDDGGGIPGSPRLSDRPPVGEPLVVSRRHGGRRPAESAEPAVVVPTGPLAGQVGLVTGAAGEIGGAFVDALVDRGARVLLVDDDLDSLRSTAARLPSDDRAVVLRCDLSSVDDVEAACEFVRLAGASVDLVVHAATVVPAPTTDAVEALDRQYAVGVRAPTLLSTRLAPSMSSSAGVLFVDREPPVDDAGGTARRAVLDAARQGLVDVLRHELVVDDVRLLSASCSPSSDAAEFAAVVLDAACRPGVARVTSLSVGATLPIDPAVPVEPNRSDAQPID